MRSSGTDKANQQPLVVAAFAVLCVLAFPVRAQLLDLSGPDEPGAGDGHAALAIAADLAGADSGEAGGAWRSLAAVLLREANTSGEPAAEMYLIARTMAAHADAFDETAHELDAGERMLIAAVLRGLSEDPPTLAVSLERSLRAALVPLALDPPRAWVIPGENGKTIPEVDLSALADATAQPIRNALDLFGRARQIPAYTPTASRLHARIAECVALIGDPPNWLDDESRAAITAALLEACRSLTDAEPAITAERGVEILEACAAVAMVVRTIDALPPDPTTRASREAVYPLSADLTRDPVDVADRCRAFAVASALLDTADNLPDDRELIRQLKPAHRILRLDAIRAADRLRARLPTILSTPRPFSDPATLALLSDQRDEIGIVLGLSTVDRVIRDPERRARPRAKYEAFADRLLTLGQRARDDAERAEVVRILRLLPSQIGLIESLPLEAELRETNSDSGAVALAESLSSRSREEIAREIDGLRARWVEDWTASVGADTLRFAGDRLLAVEAWLRLVRALSDLERNTETLNAWAGWEVDPEAVVTTAQGLDGGLSTTYGVVMGDRTNALDLVNAMHDRYAFVPLADLLVRTLGLNTAPQEGGLGEVAYGAPMPGATPALEARSEIAAVCWFVEDAAFAARLGEGEDAERFRQAAARRAVDAIALIRSAVDRQNGGSEVGRSGD